MNNIDAEMRINNAYEKGILKGKMEQNKEILTEIERQIKWAKKTFEEGFAMDVIIPLNKIKERVEKL